MIYPLLSSKKISGTVHGVIEITLDYIPPSTNSIWVRNPTGGNYLSAEYRNFKSRLLSDWIKYKSNNPNISGYLFGEKLMMQLFIHPRDNRVFDLDNRVKALLDALIGLAYADDSQIHVMHLEKRLPVPKNGLTIFSISEVDDEPREQFQRAA